MPLLLSKKRYLSAISSDLNAPISLHIILKPFGLKATNTKDPFILLGHFLESLAESTPELKQLDPLDVAGLAWDLGHQDSGSFLTTGPMMLAELYAKPSSQFP